MKHLVLISIAAAAVATYAGLGAYPEAMPFVIGAWGCAAAMYIVSSVTKISLYNRDPQQKALAGLLVGTVRNEVPLWEISNFLSSTGWNTKQVRDRMAHALTLVKLHAGVDEYQLAVRIGQDVALNWRDETPATFA